MAESGQVHHQGRDHDQDDETVEAKATSDTDDVLDDVDGMLDEIDDVLEENAEEFVKNYVQKGGQ